MNKICSECNDELDIEQFNFSNKPKDIRRKECKKCFNKKTRRHYENNKEKYRQTVRNKRIKNREFIKNYLSDKSCIDCGNNDWRVLEFDHVRGVKITNVSNMIDQMASIKKIQDEIEKCEVRCANCHKIVTHQRQDNYRNN